MLTVCQLGERPDYDADWPRLRAGPPRAQRSLGSGFDSILHQLEDDGYGDFDDTIDPFATDNDVADEEGEEGEDVNFDA